MIFSSTKIENSGRYAYQNGEKRANNPYIGKQGYINKLKLNIWYWGYDRAENDSRSA